MSGKPAAEYAGQVMDMALFFLVAALRHRCFNGEAGQTLVEYGLLVTLLAMAVIGIVSIGDVVKYRLDETKLEVESLRDYVLAGR